jgi:protein phosphatase
MIDRGEFSLEVCSLIFALKAHYPTQVFLIRGNHEFRFLCEKCGFQTDVTQGYGSSNGVFDAFIGAFSQIPLTALINEKILCVHGGLAPNWFSVRQATRIERPIDDFGDQLLDGMLWSDPSTSIELFAPSPRGTGNLFGEQAVTEFLDNNLLSLLVRAHECCDLGVSFMFNNRLVTVFSASNYNGLSTNNSAVLLIDEKGGWKGERFEPLDYLRRGSVTFLGVVDDEMCRPLPLKTDPSLTGSSSKVIAAPFRPLRGLHTMPPQSATVPPRGGITPTTSSGRIVPSGSAVGRTNTPVASRLVGKGES